MTATEQQRLAVLAARGSGSTFAEAATAGNVHITTAWRWWADWLADSQPELDQITKQNTAWLAEQIAAMSDDREAFRDVLAAMERQAKYLGLDHSEKREDTKIALEAAKLELVGRALIKALEGLPDATQRQETFLTMLEAAG